MTRVLREALRRELRAQLRVVAVLAAAVGLWYALSDDVDQVGGPVELLGDDIAGDGAPSPT